MKNILKHTLLICAGLSAGALYAPGICSITPNDHRWWTYEAINQLVDSLDLANRYTRSSTDLFIKEVVNLVPKESFSLKQLYHTMLSETANRKISVSKVAGSTHAVSIIKKLANENGLEIELDDNDFTIKNVFDPEWWSVHYAAANRYISFY